MVQYKVKAAEIIGRGWESRAESEKSEERRGQRVKSRVEAGR